MALHLGCDAAQGANPIGTYNCDMHLTYCNYTSSSLVHWMGKFWWPNLANSFNVGGNRSTRRNPTKNGCGASKTKSMYTYWKLHWWKVCFSALKQLTLPWESHESICYQPKFFMNTVTPSTQIFTKIHNPNLSPFFINSFTCNFTRCLQPFTKSKHAKSFSTHQASEMVNYEKLTDPKMSKCSITKCVIRISTLGHTWLHFGKLSSCRIWTLQNVIINRSSHSRKGLNNVVMTMLRINCI